MDPCPSPEKEKAAFSFLSRGWNADLQLMRARANHLKDVADRELKTLINSASTTSAELGIVERIRRRYESGANSRLKIDLSAIRGRFVTEEELEWEWDWERVQRLRGKVEEGRGEWRPIRLLKESLGEVDRNVKSNLKSLCGEDEDTKVVLPLDIPELLASLVKQSGPLFDQLGIKRDIQDKIVDGLCSKRKNQFLSRSFSTGCLDTDTVNDKLDYRIESVLRSTGHHYEDEFWDSKKRDSTDKKRHISIITTASLPWMTGTAVNPLFRALYLAKAAKQNVTLLVPWLCKSDQELVYPNSLTFSSPEEHELYIRKWLEERVGFKPDFKISFYPGKFSSERRSIIPTGDTSQFIPGNEADIAILEEPEHLNWYHHGKRWTDKFNHVVGVVHTNYLEYIKREKNGAVQAFFVKHINNMLVRAYCHKVLRLSAATQDLPKSSVCNVHGVNPKFLKVGEKVAADKELGHKSFHKGAYFLGKMVWAKGYRELLDLLAKHKNDLDGFKLDVYGNGEDAHDVQSAARKLELNLNFLKGRDHADDSLHGYKVFINPSISDVLCTATAEALAMGKFVVCADHPSNDFFRSFPNCLVYRTSEDFVAKVREAMDHEPQPLTPEQMYNFSWEAATRRFLEFSELDNVLHENNKDSVGAIQSRDVRSIKKSVSMPNLSNVVDGGLAFAHYCLTGNEALRLATGAIPGSRDYDMQQSKDLHLVPPHVQNPTYGW